MARDFCWERNTFYETYGHRPKHKTVQFDLFRTAKSYTAQVGWSGWVDNRDGVHLWKAYTVNRYGMDHRLLCETISVRQAMRALLAHKRFNQE